MSAYFDATIHAHAISFAIDAFSNAALFHEAADDASLAAQ